MDDVKQMSLDGILSGEERKPPEAQPVKDPVEKQQAERNAETAPAQPAVERTISRKQAHRDLEQDAQGRVRDKETGQYVSKEPAKEEVAPTPKVEAKVEAPAAPAPAAPQQDMTAKEKAFLRAAEEERRKRQELQRELDALRKPAATTEPAKGFWDDPEASLKRHEEKMTSVAQQASLRTAELIARSRHTDFDEKVAIFSELVQKVPGLGQQCFAADDPAEFAYQTAKTHQELQEAGGVAAMRAKIEADAEVRVRAKIEGELKAKAEALEKEKAALPPSLTTAPSKGVNRPVWGGPTPLDGILKG